MTDGPEHFKADIGLHAGELDIDVVLYQPAVSHCGANARSTLPGAPPNRM
jgi:hypothetical protein